MEILKGRDAKTTLESDRAPVVFNDFITLCVLVHALSSEGKKMEGKNATVTYSSLTKREAHNTAFFRSFGGH